MMKNKLKEIINYLTQIALTKDIFKEERRKMLDDYVLINHDGRKGIIKNKASLNVVDFLNHITLESPVLDYGQIRALKLPIMREFKYKSSSK